MKQITNQKDLKKLGTILGIWAHPDDESYTMGAIMAAASQNGQEVVCITATRGEGGIQDESRWPAHKLGEIRERELYVCLEILGGIKHHWLEYSDGHCEHVDMAKAAQVIAELMVSIKPDTILTFGPDGMTGHPDHVAASRWADEATKLYPAKKPTVYHSVMTDERYGKIKASGAEKDIFFNIDKPPIKKPEECNILFAPSEEIAELKHRALKAQESQTAIMIEKMGEVEYRLGLMEEAFVLAHHG